MGLRSWFLEFAAFNFFVNVVVAGLGTTALAALSAVMQLNSVSFMPAFGAASAGAILVGQAIGAKRYDYASRAMWLTLLTCCVWQGAVGAACLLMPELFMQAFNLGDEGASELFVSTAVRMLMLSAAWQLFDAIVISIAESLRAAGDTSFSMWARVAVSWLIFAPGSYWTVTKWGGGDVAAVLCLVVYLGILAAVLSLRWATGRWKRIQLI